MKTIVFSDSHGNLEALITALESNENIGLAIHLGDGLREFEELCKIYKIKNYTVKGNNDYTNNSYFVKVININGKRLLLTHGHMYKVKNGITTLALKAKELDVDMVLYGHTHVQKISEVAGITLLNPGSMMGYGSLAKYAVIDINDEIKIKLLTV